MLRFNFSDPIYVRKFSLREAVLFALFLHLLLLIFFALHSESSKGLIKILQEAQKQLAQKQLNSQQPIKFTFVKLAQEKEAEPPPETTVFSDRNRKAGGSLNGSKDTSEAWIKSAPTATAAPEANQVLAESSDLAKQSLIKPEEAVNKKQNKDLLKEEETLSPDKDFLQDTGNKMPASEKPSDQGLPEEAAQAQEKATPSLAYALQNLDQYIEKEGSEILQDLPLGEGTISFDTKAFDLGPYAARLHQRVKQNWHIPSSARRVGIEGKVEIRFIIQSDGSVSDLTLVKSSGYQSLDSAALDAISNSNPFPPLPKDLLQVHKTLGVNYSFTYNIIDTKRS